MSQTSLNLPDNAPFESPQKATLNALLPTLNAAQFIWLSGYFTALAQATTGAVAPTSAPAQGHANASVARPSVPLTILYGTESGNSEGCASELQKAAQAAGFKAVVADMGDYDFNKLGKEKNVLLVVSTWGEGDPPERAVPFHELIMGSKAPSLKDVNFSVCALGDTSYVDFCGFGKQLDQRFADLGANRVHNRVDCDVDFEPPFREWLSAVIPKMVDVAGVSEAAATSLPQVAPVMAGFAPMQFGMPVLEAYGKKNPFPAELKERILLNGRGSAKETLHFELSLEGSGLSYKPGDALAVIPSNAPSVVEDLLRHAGFRGDEIHETADGRTLSLAEALQTDYDITSLNGNLLRKYAPLARNKALDELLREENKEKLIGYLWGREVRDMFQDYPPAESLKADQVLGMLRKMPPRLYSIASSLQAHPNEVHLTVGIVRYESHGHARMGVCSSFLADRIEIGTTLPVYIHENKNFFLPTDDNTPIIMVGPGTGIAPFRAFIEERAARSAKGRNWLFFGDQHFNTDFLYQLEWQDYLKSGILSRMDVAFSRDTGHKVYVQHRMKEKAKDLYAWMQEGAYFYVCGDANHMAKDVHQTLIEVIAEQGGLSMEEAEARVRQLQKDKRYQRDVY